MKAMATMKYKYVTNYIEKVNKGEIIVCKEQKQLFEYLETRVLNRNDIYYDETMVEKSIEVPAKYFPFKLVDWQTFLHSFIYGFRWKDTNELVFDTFLIYIGRGAGKNGLMAWNSFFMTSNSHGIKKYNIDFYATSEEQAKTSFSEVRDVLKDHKKQLKKSYDDTAKQIQNKKTHSVIRYNTSNARTKDGKRPGMNVFDEIHEYENYKTISVGTTGGGKVDDYREIYITTDGNIRDGVLDDLKEEAELILNGELGVDKEGAAKSSLFPFIFKLDDPQEVNNIDLWEKACPTINHSKKLKNKMLSEFSKMQRNASLKVEFMTKRMNCPIQDTRFSVAEHEDLQHTKLEDIPEGFHECIGALDYAEFRDFCSVGILVRHNGKTFWKQHTFIHRKALELQNINETLVNIAVEKGLAEIVHGDMITEDLVVNWFLEMAKTYAIQKISMDHYRATTVRPALEEAGFEVRIVPKGAITHSKLSPLVDKLFISQKLFFGDDEMMRWYVKNIYKDMKGNGNIEYKKISEKNRKTDGFSAFIHALNFFDDLEDYEEFSDDDYVEEEFQPLVF